MFKYLEGDDIKKNNLKKERVGLGLTITALSKMADVSTKVISQTERGLINPTEVTKNKILNGLNVGGASRKTLGFEDVFPQEP